MPDTPQPIPVATPAAAPAAAPTTAAPAAAPASTPPTQAPAQTPADVVASVAPYQQAEIAATKKAQELAQPTPPPPPVPHERLLRMISGLATGLGAAGTALATHGREGGVEEVVRVQGEEQRQKLEAQSAAMAKKNAQIQQQLTIADTNHKLAQNIILMSTLPIDLQMKDLALTEAQQHVVAGKASLASMQAEFMSQYGMTPDQFNGMMSGAPAATDQKMTQNVRDFSQQKVAAAAQVLPKDDPYVQKAQQILADPNASPKDIFDAVARVNRQVGLQAQVTKTKAEQQTVAETAPYGDRAPGINNAMLKRYQVMHPDAKALPDGLAVTKDSTPKDWERIDKIMQQTETAEATQAQRGVINEMRKTTLALSGMGAPQGDTSKTGPDYLATLPAAEQALVREIGIGKAAPDRMAYLLSRNPKLTAEVALAYPDWDSSRAQSYPVLYKAFTTGPESKQLVAGNVVLQHLQQLKQINDADPEAVKLRGTAANKQYNNLLTTVAGELVTFYGMPDTNESHDQIRSRDAAIKEQAHAMGVRLDELENKWKDGAPSSAYEAQMPNKMSQKAIAARAFLDPEYKPAQSSTQPPTQSVGHKAGDIITQNGHNYVVTEVDANGIVKKADPQ